jgi:hypothetical protein
MKQGPSCFHTLKLWNIAKDALCRSGWIVGKPETIQWRGFFPSALDRWFYFVGFVITIGTRCHDSRAWR